jgi:hypothetical protein
MKTKSKIRVAYNPGVGIAYIITNKLTGEKRNVSTLSSRDIEQKPWRSPQGTPHGEEFFKVKSGKKKAGFTYYKFMNSAQLSECLSDDGVWLFSGLKPDGTILPRLDTIIKKEKTVTEVSEGSSNIVRSTVEKVDNIVMNEEVIKEKVESISVDDFSASEQINELLKQVEQV